MRRLFTMGVVAAILLASPGLALADDATGGDAVAAGGESSVDELKVNINRDDATAIAARLKGVGHKRAQAIVQYREANGPFGEVDELVEVQGIGVRTVEENASLIEID